MFAKLGIYKSGSFTAVAGVALAFTFLMIAPMAVAMADPGIDSRGSECAATVFSQDLEDVLLENGSPMGGKRTPCADYSIGQLSVTERSAVADVPESTSVLVNRMRERADIAIVETSGWNTLFLREALRGLG